jgi:phosphoribosyl 1,2-cyclic phosphate phosphodiesterase
VKITFLGTGTSQGVPVIACDCDVCLSSDKKDKRLRSSIFVEIGDRNIVIDTGPDFRYQMLRENVKRLDAVLFTHEHKDHIAGLDDIRAFNQKQKETIPIYANGRVLEAIKREFYYAFTEPHYPGVPELHLHEIRNEEFTILNNIPVTPIEVMHFKLPVNGFRIGSFTYITDMKTISEDQRKKVEGTEVLILNALQKDQHISHLNLREALDFAKEINAKKTFFTHISHKLGRHEDISKLLPPNISLAYDGLKIYN